VASVASGHVCSVVACVLAMIEPAQLWLVVEPVDMRLGVDGLSQKIQQALDRSPCDGMAYAFRNRQGTRLRLLIWDGTGVWLCNRRLHRGHFVWPRAEDPVCEVTPEQWRWLICGVDWQRLSVPPPSHWRV